MGWIQKLSGGGAGKQPAANPREVFREELAGRLRAQGFANVVALTDGFGVACRPRDLTPVRWRTATELPDGVVAALEAAGVRAGEL